MEFSFKMSAIVGMTFRYLGGESTQGNGTVPGAPKQSDLVELRVCGGGEGSSVLSGFARQDGTVCGLQRQGLFQSSS